MYIFKYFAFKTKIFSSYFTYPLRIIMTLEHMSSASLIEWVVNTMLPVLSVLIVLTIDNLETGSRPVEHSSRYFMSGLPIKEMIMQSFRLFPPLKF